MCTRAKPASKPNQGSRSRVEKGTYSLFKHSQITKPTRHVPQTDPSTIPAIAPPLNNAVSVSFGLCTGVEHTVEGASMNASKPPSPVQYLASLQSLVGLKASPLTTFCSHRYMHTISIPCLFSRVLTQT